MYVSWHVTLCGAWIETDVDADTGTHPGSHESTLGFIAAIEKSVNVWADTQAHCHINKTRRFNMNQEAELTHTCTHITTQADKTGLNTRHQSALSPEVKLGLDGLKSAIWDQQDTVCMSRTNLSLWLPWWWRRRTHISAEAVVTVLDKGKVHHPALISIRRRNIWVLIHINAPVV